MEVLYNKALEFFGFLSIYIEQKIEKERDEYNIPPNQRLQEIFDEVDREISPFLKHDIELFFNKMFLILWILFYMIRKYEIESDEMLFKTYKGFSDDEFCKIILGHLHIEDMPVEKVTQKDINDGILANFFHPARGQAKMIYQLLNDPGEWRQRIVDTLEKFHDQHYLQYRDELLTRGEAQAALFGKQLREDTVHVLDTVTLGHYKELLNHSEDVTVYLSYTYDRGFILSIKQNVILLGMTRESLLTSANRKLQTNLLFSALSDRKRIEILRLLGEREWFSNELAKHFGITPATMSYHLNKLLNSGLLSLRLGDQKKAYYRLNRENLINYLECARADLVGDVECSARTIPSEPASE